MLKHSIQKDVYAYMGGILKDLECKAIIINGTENHVHVLCRLSPKVTVAKLVEVIKKRTSLWIKIKYSGFESFYWQDGYSAFSVSASQLDRVKDYIKNQETHHKEKDFKTELKNFLDKLGMEYNEKYLWH